jgi:predicted acyltransferase
MQTNNMDTSKRLLALDVFRGMTIAGMILVNNPGNWGTTYAPLLHAKWHGCTPTDWVFPFFIFIVGVAIPLALGKRKEAGLDNSAIYQKILFRTLAIFGIGLLLHLIPNFNFAQLRIPGVLQRIALVYGATATIYMLSTWRQQVYMGIALLLGYWSLMTLVPVPGGIAPNLDPETNLGAWLDRTLLTSNHLWKQSKTWDPEGLLSTLPAIVTGIIGMLTGEWLKTIRTHYEKLTGIFGMGVLLLAAGMVWDMVFPINKQLWTSSYVVYMGGVSLLFLGVVYWLVDVLHFRNWIKPFVVYGTNALFAFVLSGLLAKMMYTVKITTGPDTSISLQGWLYQQVYLAVWSDYNASLAYALTNVLFILGITWMMYRRKIFIRL